jgi:predicted transcriptional regulator
MMRFITRFRTPCYSLLKLGEAQEKILKHFFECDIITPEGVSHISKSISLWQPSVHRSVSSLIKNKYLIKENKRTRKKGKMSFEKALYVTDKGAAAAVVLGITFDQLENYLNKFASYESALDSIAYFKRFKKLYKNPEKREFTVKNFMEYLLNNNCFSDSGTLIYPSGYEFKRILRYVQDRSNEAFGNVSTIKQYLERYGVDKSFLKEAFQKDKKRIDSILRQLEKWD